MPARCACRGSSGQQEGSTFRGPALKYGCPERVELCSRTRFRKIESFHPLTKFLSPTNSPWCPR